MKYFGSILIFFIISWFSPEAILRRHICNHDMYVAVYLPELYIYTLRTQLYFYHPRDQTKHGINFSAIFSLVHPPAHS